MEGNVIHLDLDSHLEFVSEYDDNFINSKLEDFILNYDIDYKKELDIDVCFHYLNDDFDYDYVRKIFLNTFNQGIKNNNIKLKEGRNNCLFMLILGISSSIMYFWLSYLNVPVFSEFFLILCWISFGEIIEYFLFYRKKIVLNNKKYVKLLESNIKIVLDEGDL